MKGKKKAKHSEDQANRPEAEMNPNGYMVLNTTDGLWVDFKARTMEQAIELAETFPRRFDAQGYYKTASGERIDPDRVALVILPAPDVFASNGMCPKCRQPARAIDMDCRRWGFCGTDRIRWFLGDACGPDMSAEIWHSVADRVHEYPIVDRLINP